VAFEFVLAFVVGGIASVMAAITGWRFVATRKAHHMFWSVGMALWAASAVAQGIALVSGWSVPMYKAYYVSAIALAGFLGAGTLELVLRRRRALLAFDGYILGMTGILGLAVALAPVDETLLGTAVIGGLALPSGARIWSPFINIPGGIAFIGGAAYSYVKLRRPFALLITIGAATPAVGGVLARFAMPAALPFTDFIGVVFLAAGIVLSLRPLETPSPVEASTTR
jgi:hypothetical protein